MEKNKERRRYPRIKDKDVAIKLSGDGFNTITQSLDISASGIYCKVDRPIPLMTRLQLLLTLPGRGGKASITMNVDGVVVREHPVMKDDEVQYYDLAIFFNTLLPKERKKIVQYIEQRAK